MLVISISDTDKYKIHAVETPLFTCSKEGPNVSSAGKMVASDF